jgi:acetylornithine deacetylase/succinyl-diaminopimelate desuccinylase-like protein
LRGSFGRAVAEELPIIEPTLSRRRAAKLRKRKILAALAAGIWALPGCAFPLPGRALPNPDKDLAGAASQLLSEAIQINTVNPPGDERPLAELLVSVARREGLEARVIETPSEESKTGRAAVWARLPGTGKRPPVVLLSHLDVVPAEPNGWAVDPFGGLIAGGYVVGRGALDAKGLAVMHLLAMAKLARRNVELSRDVILLATPDEETGGRDGAGFIAQRHKDLLRGAEFLLTEGGGILLGTEGAPNVWGVAVAEKAPCWTRLTAKGTAGHASTGGLHGPVPRLVAALERLRRMQTEVRVVPEVDHMFRELAPLAEPEDRAGLANLGDALANDAEFRRRFLADDSRAALVRDTIAVTVLRAGSSPNVVPEEARADLDVRLLPDERCDEFLEQLRDVVADPSIRIDPILAFETRSSPADTELFRAIESVAREIDPGALVLPRVIAGFTDAHYFRELGIVSYGFVPRWLPPSETRGIHGPNERVSIENMERGINATAKILEALGR